MFDETIAGRRVIVTRFNSETRKDFETEMTALALGVSNHNTVLICEEDNGAVWVTPLTSFHFVEKKKVDTKESVSTKTTTPSFGKDMRKQYTVEGKRVLTWGLLGDQTFQSESDAKKYVEQLFDRRAFPPKKEAPVNLATLLANKPR